MNAFYILGSIASVIYICKTIVGIYIGYQIEKHDKNCEDCADDIMSETFKHLRDDEEGN